MNKTTLALVTLAALAPLALTGCNRGQRQQGLAQDAPAPIAFDDQPFEPVEVEPAGAGIQLEPVELEPYQPAPADNGGLMPGANTYTIQRGDTLWSIASMYYGNGQRWTDILNANPGLDPQKLPVGKTIVMP